MYNTTHHGLIYGIDHKPTWEEWANIHPHFETAVLRTQFRTQIFRITRKTTNTSTETTGYAKGTAGFAKTSLQADQGWQLKPRTIYRPTFNRSPGWFLCLSRPSEQYIWMPHIYCETRHADNGFLLTIYVINALTQNSGGGIQRRISIRPQKLR
jgi:hypothetical protein